MFLVQEEMVLLLIGSISVYDHNVFKLFIKKEYLGIKTAPSMLLALHPSQANNKDKKGGGPLQKHLKFILKLPKTNQPSTQLTPQDPTASQLLKDIVPAILSFLHYKLPLFCYWLNPNDLQKCCYFSQHKKEKKIFCHLFLLTLLFIYSKNP